MKLDTNIIWNVEPFKRGDKETGNVQIWAEVTESNAPKIIKAVNSHEVLFGIVKELQEAINRGGDLQLGPTGRHATLEQRVNEAIKQAEGR